MTISKLLEYLNGIQLRFEKQRINQNQQWVWSSKGFVQLNKKLGIAVLETLKKSILTVFVCLVSETIYAVEFEVVGPCDPKPRLEVYVEIKNIITLGDLTVNVLNDSRVPFKGDVSGIAQIENSPIGLEAVEFLNPMRYRAYGWCVHVDNFEPGDMPNQVEITEGTKKISWFYAYSLSDNGVWKDYCTPSWQVRSLAICNK